MQGLVEHAFHIYDNLGTTDLGGIDDIGEDGEHCGAASVPGAEDIESVPRNRGPAPSPAHAAYKGDGFPLDGED